MTATNHDPINRDNAFRPLPTEVLVEQTAPDGTKTNVIVPTDTLMPPLIRADDTGSEAEAYWATTYTIEYCPLGCDGIAHSTGEPDEREGCFCGKHVHRSVHVKVHKIPALAPEMQGF